MATTVWINEIDYDNVGTDNAEFIELAGASGTDLTGWSLVLYNGSTMTAYATKSLDGLTIGDQDDGWGTTAVQFLADNSIQNGSPDGIALVDALGNVVQFLSYEGSFTAVDGAAIGLASTQIGDDTLADSNTEAGSLQLTGTGNDPSLMTWTFVTAPSAGDVNSGQDFAPTNLPATFSGDTVGSVQDVATPTAAGTLVVDDDDSPATMIAQSGAASDEGYGTFSIDTSGNWTFVLDEDNSLVNTLVNGQTLVDTLTVSSFDGTTTEITITIEGINKITGTEGSDRDTLKINGSGEGELIMALAGADEVLGFAGDDYILGGQGSDRLSGGTDADHFLFDDGDTGLKARARDVITDFKHAEGDMFDLSDIDAIVATELDEAFNLVGSEAKALRTSGSIWIDVTARNERTIFINNDADKKFDLAIDVLTKDKLALEDFIL